MAQARTAGTAAGPAGHGSAGKGFRSARLGWPELHRIPHPPRRVPVLGDVLGASVRSPVQDSMRVGRQLGPVFRRKAFNKEIVFVWGADLAAELADESRFAKHVGLGVANLRPLAGDGLFTAYNHEPNWQLAHDILAPGFSRAAMEGYHPLMLDVARQLTAFWDERSHAGEAVDVPGDMTKLTLETIARTGFGHDFGSFERSRPHPFVTAMVGALSYAQRRNTAPPLLGPLMQRGAAKRDKADRAYLDSTVDQVVEARRGSDGTGARGDLLDRMLETAHPDTGERLSPRNIRRQVVTFLVAGHETTSGALSFALHYLSRNPAVLRRAQAEVEQVWGGTEEPAYEQVARLRYVRRVLDESLRLWPTAPAFSREALRATTLGGLHPMHKGAWALVLIMLLHRDPAAWGEDAETFDPDRFEPKAVRARPPHVFKPFGTGARACIGRQFALHEATLVLGLLLRRYDFRADPDYRLEVSERLTLMPRGLRLHLTRRTHSPQARTPAAARG
ncbi:cytochrome [Streptomyces abyssalis]|uniref:Cytochrome n=1 Tax=Streptomyces abyssalis TaxID=933944 RepID=A0A1E7JUN9_9ACTN|nr:cytochrome P450 [Streptomyces abyssalis]OEU89356.1 cytochrome [Streptomyces abyssalis]OEU93671.1 cytochrome [Streptomyces abyssalis]